MQFINGYNSEEDVKNVYVYRSYRDNNTDR